MAVPSVIHIEQEEGRAALRTWLRLLACTNLIETHIRSQLRQKFETTLPRFDILAQLDVAEKYEGRGLAMSELSQRLMVTNGNITGLIERLRKERLVTRSLDPNDRRTQVVRLTPSGRRAFDKMVPEHRAWIEEIFSVLNHKEHTQIHELLGRLKDTVQHILNEDQR